MRRIFPFVLTCLATLALAVRMFSFIDRYSVDLLFSDQLDFLTPQFSGDGLWDAWRWQHGPHRQGVGGLILAAIMPLAHWDARAIAVAAGVLAVLATVAALALARVLRGRWSVWDATLPLIVLTLSQAEFLVETPNPAIGPTAVMFVLLFALCLLVREARLRLVLLVLVSFAMEQTGYTILFAAIAIPLFCLLLARAVRERQDVVPHVIALTASIASVVFFAWGLTPLVGGECSQTGTEPASYVRFTGLMFLRPFETRDPALLPVGIALALGCFTLATVSAWHTLRTHCADRRSAVVLCLAGFTSISSAMATLGRACGGPNAGARSAYVTYVLPFLVALYLTLSMRVTGRVRHALLATLFVVLLAKEFAGTLWYSLPQSDYYASGKLWWRECYFQTGNPLWCNQSFEVYPNPAATHMEAKMQFLRERRAGPFREVK